MSPALLPDRAASYEAARVVLRAVLRACVRHRFATLSEMYLKVVSLSDLLDAGYSVIEGSSHNRVKVMRLEGGLVSLTIEPRVALEGPDGPMRGKSADIRVAPPAGLVVELKARSVHGTQDAVGSNTILKDLGRVGKRTVDLFVLAADRSLYDGLRGYRADPRGRKARAPELFYHTFPASEALSDQLPIEPIETLGGTYHAVGARVAGEGGTERVVLGLWRGPAKAPAA